MFLIWLILTHFVQDSRMKYQRKLCVLRRSRDLGNQHKFHEDTLSETFYLPVALFSESNQCVRSLWWTLCIWQMPGVGPHPCGSRENKAGNSNRVNVLTNYADECGNCQPNSSTERWQRTWENRSEEEAKAEDGVGERKCETPSKKDGEVWKKVYLLKLINLAALGLSCCKGNLHCGM